jgi:hypothetical protein
MAFKSYSWVIGTTSFRVSQLNYKIERQLELLKQFWNINPSLSWNNSTQEKFYDFLKSNNFIQGDAPRKDKDAREITSGLVDIGVLDSSRKLTEVGSKIEGLLNKERIKNNIFYIDDEKWEKEFSIDNLGCAKAW